MIAEAERIVRDEWGVRAMRMTVIDVRDELIAFYERRGYVRTGVFKPFPYGDERFGVPRRPDLRFEILEKRLLEYAGNAAGDHRQACSVSVAAASWVHGSGSKLPVR